MMTQTPDGWICLETNYKFNKNSVSFDTKYLSRSVCLSVTLSIDICVCDVSAYFMPVYLLSGNISLSLSLSLLIHLAGCLSVVFGSCLSVCLCVHLFVCLY